MNQAGVVDTLLPQGVYACRIIVRRSTCSHCASAKAVFQPLKVPIS